MVGAILVADLPRFLRRFIEVSGVSVSEWSIHDKSKSRLERWKWSALQVSVVAHTL